MTAVSGQATFTGFDPYKLTGIGVTDRELGHGSYATVLELEYMGLKCAGKKIHELLLRQGDTSYTVRKFEEECRLLSQVRHPNIVQFLGVYFQQGVRVPILVMEFLPTNLTSCIEKYGILPKEISYSILHDVALGLCYLHSQNLPIIHRNLYSNNVLLTPNMTAKISDLGKAKILMNMQTTTRMMSTDNPDKIGFVAPEAMVNQPEYGISIDEFSYGVMMIHMFSGKWPMPQIPQICIGSDGNLTPVSEAERRKVFLQDIGDDHPLMDLIKKCIHNDPQQRPCASEIVKRLAEMVLKFPASFANRLETLREIEADRKKCESMAKEINLLKNEHSSAVEDLRLQVTTLTEHNEQLKKYETEVKSKIAEGVNSEDMTVPLRTEAQLDKDSATGQNAAEIRAKGKGKPTSSTDSVIISQAFPGVEVCAETTVVVTNNQQSFHWKGYGLKLHIPKSSLPTGMEQCTIKIMASLTGQYEFPKDSHLVSGVFWLRCEPSCKFAKSLSLEIQHCARRENVSKLSFVRAFCTLEELPYTFEQLDHCFTNTSSYGLLQLQSFSGIAITQKGSQEREYIAQLFYLNPTISTCEIHLVVTWNIEAHLTVVGKHLEQAFTGPDQPVEFEADHISLDILPEGSILKEGWKLTPLASVVTKRHIDNYQPGQRIPTCQLSAEFKSTSAEGKPIPALEHYIKLKGAKEPYNTFTIKPPTPTSGAHAVTSTTDPKSETTATPLTLNDLLEVYNKVQHARSKWYFLGLGLRIHADDLDSIKGEADSCLLEVLKIFLKRANPKPTWQQLADALDNPSVGQSDLATKIKSPVV